MAERSAGKGAQTASQAREDRLKAALKANMARRKAQARGRAVEGDADQAGHETPDIDDASGGE